ncbi:MAG: hypothetical protein ACO398_09960, partial [Kiritimatiellia bacterium]
AALKGTPVKLIELRLADDGLSGKGFSMYEGELHDIESAVELSTAFLERARGAFSHRILTAPHDALRRHFAATTRFHEIQPLQLEGERV